MTRDAGFTLVEVLMALFVFSILSTATMAAMTSTIRTKDAAKAANERIEDIARFDRLLRQDLAAVTTRATRDAYGTQDLASFQTYTPDGALLTFTRSGRDNPGGAAPRGDLMRVSYRLLDDQLIRETPALPTPAINTPVQERVVLDGVERIDITASLAGRDLLQVNVPPDGTELPTQITFEIETERGPLNHVVRVGR